MPLPHVVGVTAMLIGIDLCLLFVIAVALFGQFLATRRWPLAIMATAFGYAAMVTVAYLFAFPGILASHRIVGANDTTDWLWFFERGGFMLMIATAMVADRFARPLPQSVPARFVVGTAVGFDLAAACAVTAFALHSTPIWRVAATIGGVRVTPVDAGLVLLIVSATTLVYAVMLSRGRDVTIVNLWLTIVLLAAVIDISVRLSIRSAYSLGGYLSDTYWTFALGVFICIVLREISAMTNQFAAIANSDALTGLANRRSLDSYLTQLEHSRRRQEDVFALLMIDVDHFKAFNDHFGHAAGDSTLQAVSGVIRGNLARGGDFAARYGGEEFVVVLPATDRNGAIELARRIRRDVELLGIPHIAGRRVLTVSIGMVTSAGDRQIDPRALLAQADGALYHAKASGRNRISEASSTRSGQFRVLGEDLRSA